MSLGPPGSRSEMVTQGLSPFLGCFSLSWPCFQTGFVIVKSKRAPGSFGLLWLLTSMIPGGEDVPFLVFPAEFPERALSGPVESHVHPCISYHGQEEGDLGEHHAPGTRARSGCPPRYKLHGLRMHSGEFWKAVQVFCYRITWPC